MTKPIDDEFKFKVRVTYTGTKYPKFTGKKMTFPELDMMAKVGRQVIYSRWKLRGRPEEIDDTMLFPINKGSTPGKAIRLTYKGTKHPEYTGKKLTLKELTALTGLGANTIRERWLKKERPKSIDDSMLWIPKKKKVQRLEEIWTIWNDRKEEKESKEVKEDKRFRKSLVPACPRYADPEIMSDIPFGDLIHLKDTGPNTGAARIDCDMTCRSYHRDSLATVPVYGLR